MISCLWLAFLQLQILDKLGYAVTGGFREVEELGMSWFSGQRRWLDADGCNRD